MWRHTPEKEVEINQRATCPTEHLIFLLYFTFKCKHKRVWMIKSSRSQQPSDPSRPRQWRSPLGWLPQKKELLLSGSLVVATASSSTSNSIGGGSCTLSCVDTVSSDRHTHTHTQTHRRRRQTTRWLEVFLESFIKGTDATDELLRCKVYV